MVTRRLKGLDVNVDGIRNSICSKKSRRSGAEKWKKSDLLGESDAINRSDVNGKGCRAGRGGGRDSCGGGARVEGMSVAAVDGGCSIAACDGVWVRTGVSPVRTSDVADHNMGRGEMRRRGEAASAGYACALVLNTQSLYLGIGRIEEGGGRSRKVEEGRGRMRRADSDTRMIDKRTTRNIPRYAVC